MNPPRLSQRDAFSEFLLTLALGATLHEQETASDAASRIDEKNRPGDCLKSLLSIYTDSCGIVQEDFVLRDSAVSPSRASAREIRCTMANRLYEGDEPWHATKRHRMPHKTGNDPVLRLN